MTADTKEALDGATACINGCLYEGAGVIIESPSGFNRTGQSTGQSCTAGNSPGEAEAGDGVACIIGESSNVTCIANGFPENCGTFNGDQICLGDAPPGDCTFLPGGSFVCGGGAGEPMPDTTPPVPGDGEPPSPVPPDVTIHDGDGGPGQVGVWLGDSGDTSGTDTLSGTPADRLGQAETNRKLGEIREGIQDLLEGEGVPTSAPPGLGNDDGGGGEQAGAIGDGLGDGGGVIGNLLSYNFSPLVSTSYTCTPFPSMTVLGVETGEVDWCPAWAGARDVVGWAFNVLTLAGLYLLMTKWD